MNPPPRALLLTDVVDSTRLSHALGDEAMARLWTEHDRAARDLTAAGYKVKLDAPKLQLADVQEVEYAGALAFQFSTTFSPNAGNDEFKITTS